jgi:hypothetical protein
MLDRLLWRLGSACGIFYVVLLMAGDNFGGTESGTGILLELLGFALFPFFLGVLWASLRSVEGDAAWLSATAFGAGLVALAIKLGSGAPILAIRANAGIDPQIERALIAMNDASFGITFLPLAVMLSATAAIVIRWGALPRWLGWVAAVTGLGLLGALAAVVISPSPPEWASLPMLLFLLWMVATSIALIRRAGAPRLVETVRPAEGLRRARGNDRLSGGADANRFEGDSGTDTATDFNPIEGDTRSSIP